MITEGCTHHSRTSPATRLVNLALTLLLAWLKSWSISYCLQAASPFVVLAKQQVVRVVRTRTLNYKLMIKLILDFEQEMKNAELIVMLL